MSATNGDRARFHKNRKRKLLHRMRIQALVSELRETRPYTPNALTPASALLHAGNDAASPLASGSHHECAPVPTGN